MKKITALISALIIMATILVTPVSAASKTFYLYVNQKESTAAIGDYNKGNLQYAHNSSISDTRMNMYVHYEDNGKWVKTHHEVVKPGVIYGDKDNKNFGSPRTAKSPTKTIWRGKMNSWWINGKNIRATSKFHAYN